MPTEDELRDLLRNQTAPNRLDAGRVVRASRRRRIPQQIAAGGVGTLAIAAIAVFGIQTTQFGQGASDSASAPMMSEDSQESQLGYGGDAVKRLPADRLNLCGAPVTDAAPSYFGLQLEVVAPAVAAAGTAPVQATVRMTNAGTETVTGTTLFGPALTLSQDGVTVWHSNGAVDSSAVLVDLAPGASMEYVTTFTPVLCGPEDDALPEFRSDLPALAPGAYELSAAIDFNSDIPTPTTELDLVTGPRSPLQLQ